jgi:hypothetical protein
MAEGTAVLPFATSLLQSESKVVASTQSRQGNNEWGVDGGRMAFSALASCLQKARKRAQKHMYIRTKRFETRFAHSWWWYST